jgi:glutamyl-tRNA synthetase
MLAYLFAGDTVSFDEKSVEKCLRVTGAHEALLRVCATLKDSRLTWETPSIEAALRGVPAELEQKPKLVFQAVRVAICGNMVSPPLFESLELLGKKHSVARVEHAIEMATAYPTR